MRRYLLWMFAGTIAVSCGHEPASISSTTGKPVVSAPSSPDTVNSPKLLVVCLLEGDERRIELFDRDSGCVLKYTKFGDSKEVGTSLNGMAHCLKILETIESYLKDSGFQCGS